MDGDTVTVNGKKYTVTVGEAKAAAASASTGAETAVTAPVPGTVMKLTVAVGDTVKKGQPVAMIEVMKMESPIPAPADGTVSKITVQKGDQVKTGQTLMTLA